MMALPTGDEFVIEWNGREGSRPKLTTKGGRVSVLAATVDEGGCLLIRVPRRMWSTPQQAAVSVAGSGDDAGRAAFGPPSED